jgi:hypothetical protein
VQKPLEQGHFKSDRMWSIMVPKIFSENLLVMKTGLYSSVFHLMVQPKNVRSTE